MINKDLPEKRGDSVTIILEKEDEPTTDEGVDDQVFELNDDIKRSASRIEIGGEDRYADEVEYKPIVKKSYSSTYTDRNNKAFKTNSSKSLVNISGVIKPDKSLSNVSTKYASMNSKISSSPLASNREDNSLFLPHTIPIPPPLPPAAPSQKMTSAALSSYYSSTPTNSKLLKSKSGLKYARSKRFVPPPTPRDRSAATTPVISEATQTSSSKLQLGEAENRRKSTSASRKREVVPKGERSAREMTSRNKGHIVKSPSNESFVQKPIVLPTGPILPTPPESSPEIIRLQHVEQNKYHPTHVELDLPELHHVQNPEIRRDVGRKEKPAFILSNDYDDTNREDEVTTRLDTDNLIVDNQTSLKNVTKPPRNVVNFDPVAKTRIIPARNAVLVTSSESEDNIGGLTTNESDDATATTATEAYDVAELARNLKYQQVGHVSIRPDPRQQLQARHQVSSEFDILAPINVRKIATRLEKRGRFSAGMLQDLASNGKIPPGAFTYTPQFPTRARI